MKQITPSEFIEKSKTVHGDKYDYKKTTYKNSKIKVTITCPEHGDFEQIPYDHFSGHGCNKCAVKFKFIKLTLTTEQFIEKAKSIHGDKYSYDKVIYKNSNTKIVITCDIHGDFNQQAGSHLQGIGCPNCKADKLRDIKLSNTNDFIEKARAIHGDRYDYSDTIYEKSKKKILIICPVHGEFIQHAGSHLRGVGCPNCKESKGEKLISEILDKYNIKYIREYKIPNTNTRFRYDFYLPDHNLLIEFHGGQHFFPVEFFGGVEVFNYTRKNDAFKKEIAKLINIRLIEITYLHLKKLTLEEFTKYLFSQINTHKGR